MLTRLTGYLERGVIDNRRHDLVMVELYLKGESNPLVLNLEGNCHRDIAGTLLTFEVKPDRAGRIMTDAPCRADIYHGLVGDITASKKAKTDARGRMLGNLLYFEAFIDGLGLLVVEGDHFTVTVSEFEWEMDVCCEQAQIMCNQQVLRDYVQTWVKQFSNNQGEFDPLPDHHWDIRLREAEGMAIAYQEVHYKYRNQICADTCEAFIMGWDDMLGELADSDENGTSFRCRISGSLSLFDILTDEEAIETQLCMSHPLFQQIINITETAQKLFSKEINDLQLRKIMPCQELEILFQTIRYVTPNVLSCLLQINEGGAQHQILAERLNRCSHYIDRMLLVFPDINGEGIKEYNGMFLDLKHGIMEMRSDLLQQGKL